MSCIHFPISKRVTGGKKNSFFWGRWGIFWEKKEGVERGIGALGGGMKGKEEWGRLCSDMGTWGKPIVIRG